MTHQIILAMLDIEKANPILPPEITNIIVSILTVFGGLKTIDVGSDVIGKWLKRIRKPETDQDTKIENAINDINDVKARLAKADEKFERDYMALNNLKEVTESLKETADEFHEYKRLNNTIIDRMDKAISLLLKSNSAIMSHALNGNDVDRLKKVNNDINDYLMEGTVSRKE